MADLSALILAAGRGVRMGPRGRLTPKGLLEINGVPLVARSVALLQARGIEAVRIVTGHLDDQYRAAFEGHAGVELIHNSLYDQTGSLQSLMTGLEGLDGHVVLLDFERAMEEGALWTPVCSEGRVSNSCVGAACSMHTHTRMRARYLVWDLAASCNF